MSQESGKGVTRIAIVVLALFLLLPTASLAQHQIFSGKVVGVLDGDTIDVMHGEKPERVRLNGIDCPEKGQAFGSRAKQFTSDLAFGKNVTVEVIDHDRYGRTVGEVILPDGRGLNRELVRAGLAWWYQKYSKDATLGQLESEARAAKRGLWADPQPIPPWQFRSQGRETITPRVEPQKQETPEATVFITKTGKKYHQEGCPHLKGSKVPISLKDARAKGYEPCSVCRPPQ
jgi:endonuclease YncB( thermonuclease family)